MAWCLSSARPSPISMPIPQWLVSHDRYPANIAKQPSHKLGFRKFGKSPIRWFLGYRMICILTDTMRHGIAVLLTGTMIDWDVTFEHQDIHHSQNVLEIVNEINRMIIQRMGLPWCWPGKEVWWIVVADIDDVTWRYVYPLLINTLRCEQNGDVMVTDGFPSPKAAEAKSVQWRHNERFGVSNHRRLHCVLRCKSKKH